MSTYLFPDVNVWLALAHELHPHHHAANKWGESVSEKSRFLFCRFTQLGLLRLLTQPAVMGRDVMSQARAWKIYDEFYENGMTELAEEPRGLDSVFRRKTGQDRPSNKEWADSYLSAFAEAADLTFVTFDRALSKRTKRSLLLKA